MSKPVELIDMLAEKIAMDRQLSWNERYRRYVIEKENLPLGLSHKEYEKEVQRLARKYRI